MTKRNPERGSAMIVTLIIIASMLAGAAVLVSMQLAGNRSTDLSRTGMTSLHCAEAGLASSRALVKANFAQWGTAITASAGGNTNLPSFLSTIDRDIDNDGSDDFTVYLKDNDDEGAPTANDLTKDQDLRVFVISKCTKFPDNPKQVMELVQYTGGNSCDYKEDGGCDGNGSFAQ
ncbi:MAG TPA: hypothetical protein VMZ53_30565 [Kofleriaceae bacterium]|nr:hypothetical protein [Kofleriaceae bacterium]